ncbi:unnamed protein product [Moneuplotes crassus]|uniref:Uncharacterized protein n=1 Tax=Euplotes crassus TaxID=5936 RepID=A0AAD1X7I9_EUPCR|nr:unnamed protein product [Moneuplotes crassus]
MKSTLTNSLKRIIRVNSAIINFRYPQGDPSRKFYRSEEEEKLDKITLELDKNKNKISDLKKAKEKIKLECKQKLEEMRQENVNLNYARTKLENDNKYLQDHLKLSEDKNTNLQNQNKADKEDLKDLMESKIAKHKRTIDSLKADNNNLRHKKASYKKKYKILSNPPESTARKPKVVRSPKKKPPIEETKDGKLKKIEIECSETENEISVSELAREIRANQSEESDTSSEYEGGQRDMEVLEEIEKVCVDNILEGYDRKEEF